MTRTPQEMIRSSHLAAVITDPNQPDNPIIECNQAFLDLTGYEREDVLGRNCRFLSGTDTDPRKVGDLRDAVSQRRPVIVELLNYRKDGSSFMNAVTIAPIFDTKGNLLAFIGSQSEIPVSPPPPSGERDPLFHERIRSLTRRQRDVIARMAQGKMIKQIAFELKLHERTVKMHRAAALKALGVSTSVEAIRIAIAEGY